MILESFCGQAILYYGKLIYFFGFLTLVKKNNIRRLLRYIEHSLPVSTARCSAVDDAVKI